MMHEPPVTPYPGVFTFWPGCVCFACGPDASPIATDMHYIVAGRTGHMCDACAYKRMAGLCLIRMGTRVD